MDNTVRSRIFAPHYYLKIVDKQFIDEKLNYLIIVDSADIDEQRLMIIGNF